ncbi:hypothetical protein BGX26_000568 [Mortierella sp. AD094]|nr:hypothetical protein BGX26_000568 [Mortierella sp. AD094]
MATRQKTLYVSGFSQRSRPRDIAYEFERFGRLVRCDVPALRNNSSRPYAFVEYEDDRDARDAFNEMRDARFEGYRLNVQFAKNTPSSSWRYERGAGGERPKSPRRGPRSPPRRRSPRRRSNSPGDRGQHRRPRSPAQGETRRRNSASRSPVRGRSRDRDGDRDGDTRMPSHERSPGANDTDKNGRGHAEARDDGDNRSRSLSPRPLSPRPRSIFPRARSVTP